MSAESLETATISLAGLGPVRIGMTFSEIESSAGVELTAVECDYKIDPGGFLNIVLETRNAETDDPTLSGIYIYEHDGLPSQIVPATAEGVRFGTPVDRLTETYPSATSLPGQGDGRYWLLEARAEGDLIAYVVDGAVAGLGSGDATELIEPNCT